MFIVNKKYIQHLIIAIDDLVSKQVNLVLNHPRFQQLEASWRGLYYLAEQAVEPRDNQIKLKILTLSWTELVKDLTRAVEFDQSQLFIKVYSHEFGHPGGEPFGLLIGDYEVSHRASTFDMVLLPALAKIAAAAFAPLIMAASPALLGLDEFSGLERPLNLFNTFQQTEYFAWKSLRSEEDARFIGLVLPKVLMRVNQAGYLWGNAVYCFAVAVLRAFKQTGWFADMSGKITAPVRQRFTTDNSPLANKPVTDVIVTSRLEKDLNDFGFIALCDQPLTETAMFYAYPSLQKPVVYDRKNVTQNARLSSMLHYILCASRFAHYLKIIARDKVGKFSTAQECENYLQQWLRQYTADSAEISHELKAKYPLREARVQVRECISTANKYFCTIHLLPHYRFDQIEANLQLKTELVGHY